MQIDLQIISLLQHFSYQPVSVLSDTHVSTDTKFKEIFTGTFKIDFKLR